MTAGMTTLDVFQAGALLLALPQGVVRRIERWPSIPPAAEKREIRLEQTAGRWLFQFPCPAGCSSGYLLQISPVGQTAGLVVERVLQLGYPASQLFPVSEGFRHILPLPFIEAFVIYGKELAMIIHLSGLQEYLQTRRISRDSV